MIKTHGLTHLNLEVSDLDTSLRFYRDMFGVEEYYRDENSVQVKGPGENDVIAFVKSEKGRYKPFWFSASKGIRH